MHVLKANTDADCTESLTNKQSTRGHCTMVGGNLDSWKSKKQVVTVKSSDEAEYRVVAHGCYELIWLKTLLSKMGFKQNEPIKLHSTGNSTIKLAKNPVCHERTKHMEVDWHYIREKIATKDVVLSYVHTTHQVADFLIIQSAKNSWILFYPSWT